MLYLSSILTEWSSLGAITICKPGKMEEMPLRIGALTSRNKKKSSTLRAVLDRSHSSKTQNGLLRREIVCLFCSPVRDLVGL